MKLMHELAVTESLLEIALRHAKQAEAGRITELTIVIGDLSSIVDDSVQFYWDIVAAGTPAQGARLEFKRIPAEMLCLDCAERFRPGADDFNCPKCQGVHIKIVAGNEFYLDSIEVEPHTGA